MDIERSEAVEYWKENTVASGELSPQEKVRLEQISLDHPKAYLRRVARVILLYCEGQPTREVVSQTGISPSQARFWRRQFTSQGMAIFPPASIEVSFGQAEVELPRVSVEEKKNADNGIQAAFNIAEAGGEPLLEGEERLESLTPQAIAQMAKAKSPGIRPDDLLAEAGRKVLRFHFIQMLVHEEGARHGENIEELHDMRVATRRMRAAFEVFEEGFQKKALREHLKGLRATGRALGGVRDMDVFIEKANAYLAERPPIDREELRPLITSWENEREKNRQKMLAYLNSPHYANFKQKFFDFLQTPGEGARSIPSDALIPQQVCEIAPVLIYTRLAAVRAYAPLVNNASLEQLHALRTEFKKLRYTLEFFREALGEEVGFVIDEIKIIQDHLGDLHDAQVATQILRDFLTQWDINQNSLPVEMRQSPDPIISYLSSRYSERHRLMTSFRDAWARFDRPVNRTKLAMAVASL